MHPDRGIFHIQRLSDGISMILDKLNTLNCQSDGMDDSPRDLLHGPVTSDTARTQPRSTLRLCSRHTCRHHNHFEIYAAASISCPLTRQVLDDRAVINTGSSALGTISNSTQLDVSTGIDSPFLT